MKGAHMAVTSHKYPPMFWDNHIKKFELSGLTRREYCEKNGLKPKALANHIYLRNRAKKIKSQSDVKNSPFMRVVIQDPSETKKCKEVPEHIPVKIITKNGSIIEFDSRAPSEWICNILKVIERNDNEKYT